MFTITQGKGFQLTFENGWTVSVQFGVGNYCQRQDYSALATFGKEKRTNFWESLDAEIAAWKKHGNKNRWFDFGDDTVKGHVTADEVAKFIDKVRQFKA